MIKYSIVLVPFPFDDFSSSKLNIVYNKLIQLFNK